MLPIGISTILSLMITGASTALAQVGFAVTGGGGARTSEAKISVNTTLQETVTLRAQIGQAERLLDNIADMEACASRQMIWVPGHPAHDATGCILLTEFQGDPGDAGAQGDPGRDAKCP